MEKTMRLIILAAGQGTRLRPLTDDRPKCLVELQGRSLLQWQIDTARAAGIQEIIVVGGYLIDHLRSYDVTVIENPRFATTNMVQTLNCATDWFDDGFVMSYGDIVYTPTVLKRLLADPAPIAVTVDVQWRSYWERRLDDPLSDAETLKIRPDGSLLEVGQKPTTYADIQAQYIGLVAFRQSGVARLKKTLADITQNAIAGQNPFNGKRSLDALYMTDLLQGMIDKGDILHACKIEGQWLEIDSVSDLGLAHRMLLEKRLG
jgi:L-glutamine-phosphate cytidylyltransferase